MVNQQFDCASCKQPSGELFFDQRYKHSICRSCFLDRRRQAAQALDSEWFMANIPFDQLTEDEKIRAGLGSQEEYDRAKKKPEADGTEGETKGFRQGWGRE